MGYNAHKLWDKLNNNFGIYWAKLGDILWYILDRTIGYIGQNYWIY